MSVCHTKYGTTSDDSSRQWKDPTLWSPKAATIFLDRQPKKEPVPVEII